MTTTNNVLDVVSIRLVKNAPIMSEKPIHNPIDAVELIGRDLCELDREVCVVINLKANGIPINCHVASMGALDTSICHPREILKTAILANAAKVMLVHNHPSGSLHPSKVDVMITDRLAQVCEDMGIPLVDHIIVGGNNTDFFSFAAKDIMPYPKPTYETEAESLQADGLLKGNENGLDLLKPLTRIEATAILVRAMGYEDAQTSGTSYFADIQSDNWGAKYANIAKDKGIAAGVGDDKFAPNDAITASQFATLILRNMGESPDWQTAINTFVERGLITSEQAEKMDLFTRGDMAKIIFEAKKKNMF